MIDIQSVRALHRQPDDGAHALPWIGVDRFNLWSLWDMIKFFAPSLLIAMGGLRSSTAVLSIVIADGHAQSDFSAKNVSGSHYPPPALGQALPGG